jgi:hypothetical protein
MSPQSLLESSGLLLGIRTENRYLTRHAGLLLAPAVPRLAEAVSEPAERRA